MLVGPVVIACGVVVLVLSVEVCLRRKEFIDKNPEVELANDDDDDRQVSHRKSDVDYTVLYMGVVMVS